MLVNYALIEPEFTFDCKLIKNINMEASHFPVITVRTYTQPTPLCVFMLKACISTMLNFSANSASSSAAVFIGLGKPSIK